VFRAEEEDMRNSIIVAALVVASGVARASDLVGVYGVANTATIQKSDPPGIVLSGAFAPVDTQSAQYVAAKGYMYFVCPKGQEKICAMEWADLQKMAGSKKCFGFGSRRDYDTFAMRFNGSVRDPAVAPASPDEYPIAMGVSEPVITSNPCQELQTLSAGVPVPVEPPPGNTPPGGEQPRLGGSGCTLAARAGASGGIGALFALAFGTLLGRRRRA
jgi:hypothetical protein